MKENFGELLRSLYFGIDETGGLITEHGGCYSANEVIESLDEQGLIEC